MSESIWNFDRKFWSSELFMREVSEVTSHLFQRNLSHVVQKHSAVFRRLCDANNRKNLRFTHEYDVYKILLFKQVTNYSPAYRKRLIGLNWNRTHTHSYSCTDTDTREVLIVTISYYGVNDLFFSYVVKFSAVLSKRVTNEFRWVLVNVTHR